MQKKITTRGYPRQKKLGVGSPTSTLRTTAGQKVRRNAGTPLCDRVPAHNTAGNQAYPPWIHQVPQPLHQQPCSDQTPPVKICIEKVFGRQFSNISFLLQLVICGLVILNLLDSLQRLFQCKSWPEAFDPSRVVDEADMGLDIYKEGVLDYQKFYGRALDHIGVYRHCVVPSCQLLYVGLALVTPLTISSASDILLLWFSSASALLFLILPCFDFFRLYFNTTNPLRIWKPPLIHSSDVKDTLDCTIMMTVVALWWCEVWEKCELLNCEIGLKNEDSISPPLVVFFLLYSYAADSGWMVTTSDVSNVFDAEHIARGMC